MRSCALLALACALLCAGTQASDLLTFDIGESFPITVRTSLALGAFSCQLRTPSGETIQFIPENEGDPEKYTLRNYNLLTGCAVDVKITDRSDEGTWELSFAPNAGGNGGSREIAIAVNAPITPETNANQQEIVRNVEYENEQFFNTSVSEKHQVRINVFDFVTTESCHLETPEGTVFNLNEVNIDGIEVLRNVHVACGIEINVNKYLVGKWVLFSRDTRFSSPIERRLNFTIYLEEIVRASPEEITILKGNNLYVRLANATSLQDTCKLVNPIDDTDIVYSVDENHKEECGFIVQNVQLNYTGRWEIVYGDKIIYKAPIEVTVNEPITDEELTLEWARDRAVDVTLGPENAVYCRVADPSGRVLFEGFERCRITLDRVRSSHGGVWNMTVGVPGKVLTEERTLTVIVKEAASRPRVITRVEKQQPEVLLTCALEGQHTITSCKFREPSGRVLLATQGVGEDRYSFHGVNVRLESSVNTTQCGLRITHPVSEDQGLWRCAMEADAEEVYYGFLRVIVPFAIGLPDDSPVVTEPILTASHSAVDGVEKETVTMSCSVQSAIRYCYFRARNGTVFNVSPGTTSDTFEYAGAGFDAGECGVRFPSLAAGDSGAWSCHVGLPDASLPEQRASFSVNVQKQIFAYQTTVAGGLAVSGEVYDQRAVEYCRFVRIDGLGFTTENLPVGYTETGSLSTGVCGIFVASPTMLDHHPWSVAAKIVGQTVEVSDSTDHTLQPSEETPTPPAPRPPTRGSPFSFVWILILLLSFSLTLLMMNLVTSKHRQWASTKASALRNSFRKKPAPSDPAPPYTQTANAA